MAAQQAGRFIGPRARDEIRKCKNRAIGGKWKPVPGPEVGKDYIRAGFHDVVLKAAQQGREAMAADGVTGIDLHPHPPRPRSCLPGVHQSGRAPTITVTAATVPPRKT